jgi:hypothetical protein
MAFVALCTTLLYGPEWGFRMNQRTAWWLAIGLAVAIFALRMTLVSGVPGFNVDDSYFHIRDAAHIRSTGLPLFDDALSYGGSKNAVAPAFDYLLATIPASIPTAAHLLTSALTAGLVMLVFALVLKASKDARAALTAALAAGFVPALWQHAFSISSSLFIAVIGFALLLCFLRSEERGWRIAFLCLTVLGTTLAPGVIVFALGLLVYLVLTAMAGVKRPRGEHELILFATLFSLWITLVLFKEVFTTHGFAVFWLNTPATVLATYFSSITVLDAVAAVGIIPFVAGMYLMYRHLFTERQRPVYLVMGLALAIGALVWARLITPSFGLELLGIALVVLFGIALAQLLRFIDKTKLPRLAPLGVAGAMVLVLLLSAIPALNEFRSAERHTLSLTEADALDWLRTHTAPDAVVLGSLDEGHLITALAQRANVADTGFLLKPHAAARVNDITIAYQAPFESDIVRTLAKYRVTYLVWTDQSHLATGLDQPTFAHDSECFPSVFSTPDATIYEARCKLEERKWQ